MKPFVSRLAVVVSAAACALLGTAPAAAARTPSSTPAFVRSSGVVPAIPRGARSLGASGGDPELSFDVTLTPRDPAALEAFDQSVSTPGSATFRRFLAPGQFASLFGPEPSTIADVRSWLSAKGLRVGATTPDGLIVPVTGTQRQVASALGIGFDSYRLVSGRNARVPTAEPLVPAGLAAEVGIVGLDDLAQPEPELIRRSSASPNPSAGPSAHAIAHDAGPQVTSSCAAAINQSGGALTADQLAQAYSFSSLYGAGDEGQGVTIGLFELEPYSSSDVSAFESCYSPVIAPSITDVTVNGAQANSCGSLPRYECQPEGGGEAALDIEMAAGMAPESDIEVYVGSDGGTLASNAAALSTYAAMVDQDTAKVISTSWGECERDLGASQIESEASLFEQAVAQGQTIVAAAGDNGSEDCLEDQTPDDQILAVDDPAGQPWVTGVGGTSISSVGPPPTESVWNDYAGATGGGLSSVWTMPSWQVGPGVQNAFTSASACPQSSGAGTMSCREVPDVAADADPVDSAFAEYWDGGWNAVGGTSMAAPMWAALFAEAEEGQSQTLGNANPSLYQAGCLANRPFNDVTTGDNQPPSPDLPTNSSGATLGGGPYYPATAGYDLATGLGTPIASELVPDLRAPSSACPLPAAPCNANDHASSPSSTSAVPTSDLGFTSLAEPVRIADTRAAASDPSTYAGDTLCPGGELTVDIPSSLVPSDAGAIVAELTAINPSASGFLSIFPAGTTLPDTANVSFAGGQTVGNLVTVGLGTDPSTGSEAVTIYNGTGTGADTDFTLDLYGYYAPQSSTSGDPYNPVSPVRILDTRGESGSGVPEASGTLMGAGASVTFSVPDINGDNVPTGAGAVALNIGVTDTTAVSYLQCYPTGSPPSSTTPTASIFWNVPGSTISNEAVIGLPAGGTITCSNAEGDTDVVVDVDGYYSAPGATGSLFNALSSPTRLLDTRPDAVSAGGTTTATASPASATAAVLNVTDIANGGNYLTAFPAGNPVPTAANVNYFPPDPSSTVSNGAYVETGTGGVLDIFDATSSANVVVDEFGYFSGP